MTVRGFRIEGDRVSAVETDGGRLGASLVVIAAGAWSRSLVRALGFDTPLDTERGYGVRIPDPGIALDGPLIYMDRHVAITPLPGWLLLAGTDELAGLRAPPNYARADALIRAARELFPDLNTDGAERWMSFRPSHPDSLPVIGRSPRQKNVYLAYGHGHLGFTMAAITGELVGQLVDGEDTTVDLEPFRPTRFRMLGRRRPLITPRDHGAVDGIVKPMIIVAGTFRMQPGSRSRFLEQVAPMVAASLEEPGCRVYAFTPDPDDADLIRLYELWDHQEALDQHFASEHMAAWQERAASLPIMSRDIMCYTVTDARPLG